MTQRKSGLFGKFGHELDELVDELRQERDRLELKIHLAKAEARDEWEQAERKWQELKAKAELAGREAKAASKDVGAAARNLAQELKRAYGRISRQL